MFNALVDSRPLEADIKLNMLNQYATGKPKQVVEHYLLTETEDAYQKARSVLQERYGNCNVASTVRELAYDRSQGCCCLTRVLRHPR